MRNKFAGWCDDCNTRVAEGAGYFERQAPGLWPKWRLRCILCVATAKHAAGKDLSLHQAEALRASQQPNSVP